MENVFYFVSMQWYLPLKAYYSLVSVIKTGFKATVKWNEQLENRDLFVEMKKSEKYNSSDYTMLLIWNSIRGCTFLS